MALGFYLVPDFLDHPVRADQKAAADDALERTSHELLQSPYAVGLYHFVGGVAEQRKIEFVFGLKAVQGLHGVRAGGKNGNAPLFKFSFCVAKLGRFDRSTGGIGFGVEEKQDAAATEIRQRDFLTVVGSEGEVGSFLAYLEHRGISCHLMGLEFLEPQGARLRRWPLQREQSANDVVYGLRTRLALGSFHDLANEKFEDTFVARLELGDIVWVLFNDLAGGLFN